MCQLSCGKISRCDLIEKSGVHLFSTPSASTLQQVTTCDLLSLQKPPFRRPVVGCWYNTYILKNPFQLILAGQNSDPHWTSFDSTLGKAHQVIPGMPWDRHARYAYIDPFSILLSHPNSLANMPVRSFWMCLEACEVRTFQRKCAVGCTTSKQHP